MPLKKCFDNAPKEIKDEFDKRVKEGMSIREVREIGTQILDSHFRDIFEGMENLKNIVDPSYKKKEFVSPLKDVSDIDKIYDDRLKELDGMDEEIENAKKEEEDREDEKEEVKPKSESKLPGQIHKGKKFMHAGSQWEVISQDGDGWKIRSGNVVTYVDDGTLKLVISRGKIRRKEVAEKYKEDLKKAFPGASDGAINKIYAALKDKSITKKQWDQRVRDILAVDRGLGSAMDTAARYSVSTLPDNVRGVDSQSVIEKTKSIDSRVVKDMQEAADFSVKQSVEAMAGDGRVSFQDLRSEKDRTNFPAGNMGQRLFIEDFDEVSPARVSSGSQLIDIIVAGNQRQKGMAAAYTIANRIIAGENGFVTKLFGRVANKIRITYNNQHKVVDQSGAVVSVFDSASAAEQYVAANLDQQYEIQYPNIISAVESDGGTIVLNAAKLGERISDFAGENRFFNWAEAAIYEELIHFATFKVATDAEIIKIGKDLTGEQRRYVQQVYGGSTFVVKKDGKVYKYFRSEYDAEEYVKNRGDEGYEIDTINTLSDYQLGAEYVRMMVQHSITGTTTEMFKPNYTVRSVLAKLIQYLKNILKSSKDSLASKIISRIEDFIKGGQAAEKPSASGPKISMVAPDVYRVAVGDKQAFIQKRVGGIYQVVQTKEGVWEPIQDGQFNAGFLGHGHTDSIGKLTERMNRELGVSIGEFGAYGHQAVIDNLAIAKKAKKNDIPKRAIKMATGWEFNNLDQKWRYEIYDTEALENAQTDVLEVKENEIGFALLSDVLPVWDLYKYYEDLRYAKIFIVPSTPENSSYGGWMTANGITLVKSDKASMLGTLIHEVQHLIQDKEGFPRGSTSSRSLKSISELDLRALATNYIRDQHDIISVMNSQIEDAKTAIQYYNELDKSKKSEINAKVADIYFHLDDRRGLDASLASAMNLLVKYGVGRLQRSVLIETAHLNMSFLEGLNHDIDTSKEYINEVNEEIDTISNVLAQGDKNQIINAIKEAMPNAGYNVYRRIGGEVEARNAEARSNVFYDRQEMVDSLLEETQDVAWEDQLKIINEAEKELGASQIEGSEGPWSSNKDANELFNELMGLQSETDRIWEESRGEYDPVEEFKYKYRKYILQDVMMTNVNRSEGYEADIAAYERQQIDYAQAEYDMRNLMSEVFVENDVDAAFDYFIIKIMDKEQPQPLKNLILRLLIEKFEGRPDIANFLREKIDTAFSTYSTMTLGSRINQRTAEMGDPASRPDTTRRPPDQYKASWGRDVDSDIITKAVEGGDDIIEAKTALEMGMSNNKFSKADYNAAIRRAEEAEDRVKEIMEEVEAARKYQSRKGVEINKMVADAKAMESQRRFLSKYEDRKSLVEAIKYLADKINKISEKCSG